MPGLAGRHTDGHGFGQEPETWRRVRLALIPWTSLGWTERSRLEVLHVLAIVWLGLVGIRLVELQVIETASLSQKALRQQQTAVELPASRGGIFDRRGRELALSTPVYSIGVFSDRVRDPERLADMLAAVMEIDREALLGRMKTGGFQWVKRFVSPGEADRVRAMEFDILHFESEPKRYYPHGEIAAHVVGTVSVDHVGQAGLEQRFDRRLRGEPGLAVMQFDAHQNRYGRQLVRRPVAGQGLELDLDLNIQSFAQMELESAVRETKSEAGTVVIMDPANGEILAMANWPVFDPNSLVRTVAEVENQRNFAVSYMVEPGSTFKVLTAAAALEEGMVATDDVFDCEMGGIWIGGRRIRDHRPFGELTMPQVLMNSSNVGIIKIGYRLGEQPMYTYLRRFGFGSPTGVELPGESAGLVRPVERWSKSSLASLAMGQEVGVTAVQMARLLAVVANGGLLVQPRIVRGVRGPDGHAEAFEHEPPVRVLSSRTAATMKGILEQVVKGGTGRLAAIPGYRVGGKTGTAQMINPVSRSYADGVYLASFYGFVPVNDPVLVGVAMLYNPRGSLYYGGRIAAPLFQKVARRALRYLSVPPTRTLPPSIPPPRPVPDRILVDFATPEPVPSLPAVEPTDGGRWGPVTTSEPQPAEFVQIERTLGQATPDMMGLTMREAAVLAMRLGIEIETTGSGVVRIQSPEADSILAVGQRVQLVLGVPPRGGSRYGASAEAGGG